MKKMCEECKTRPVGDDNEAMCEECYDYFMVGDIPTASIVNSRNNDIYNLTISTLGDGIGSGSLNSLGTIEQIHISHNKSNGKNEVEVMVNDKVVFRYDSTKNGRIVNHIQEVDKDE